MTEAHPTLRPVLSDEEILGLHIWPAPLEVILFNVQAPNAMSSGLVEQLEKESIPTLERLVARYEQDCDSLSPPLIHFGRWVLNYFIPSYQAFLQYPVLETLYDIMKDYVPSDLVEMHERHKAHAP
jgi:hypothetical protein